MMGPLPGLPQIVDNKNTLTDNIRKIDHVHVEDLQTLWKVYTTNKDVLQTGRRLENLFWRIWGSDRLYKTISGRLVAAIFMMISEGEDAIKDPSMKIPARKPSTSIKRQTLIECPPTPPPSPEHRSNGPSSPSEGLAFQPSQTALSAELLTAYPHSPPSPPSLPKVPPPSPATPLNSRPALPRSNQSYPQAALTQRLDAVTPNQEPAIQLANGQSASVQKHASFAKDTKYESSSGKVTPPLPPPTSLDEEDTSSFTSSPYSGSSEDDDEFYDDDEDDDEEVEEDDHDEGEEGEEPSDSSKRSQQATRSMPQDLARKAIQPSQISTKSDVTGNIIKKFEKPKKREAWVVDPDFRLRFQERRKKELSGTAGPPTVKLKTAATTATVSRTALSISEAKAGKSKGGGRSVYVVDDVVPLKIPDTDPIPERFDNASRDAGVPIVSASAIRKIVAEEKPALVRTKSQLTLLIEDARKEEEIEKKTASSDQSGSNVSLDTSISQSLPNQGDDDGFEDEDDEDGNLEIKKKKVTKTKINKRRTKMRTKR